MTLIILSVILFAAIGFLFYKKAYIKNTNDRLFWGLLFSGIAVRILCACFFFGYQTDMNCFSAWSDMIFKDGFSRFYTSENFTDYPPGYMYILWIIGFLKNTFSFLGNAQQILLKLPAIIADSATCILLYSFAKKHSNTNAPLITSLLIFNPAVILNSSLWGQVDSVMTLVITIMILLLYKRQLIMAYFAFAISIFIKPQAFMFAPLVLYAFFEEVLKGFNFKKFLKHILYIFSAIATVFILSLPFGINEVVSQYIGTLSSYPYATVNAFNLWGALGLNWHELNSVLSITGNCFLAAVSVASFYILHISKDSSKYFFTGAFLCFSTFILSVKMHERYAFPAMILLIFAFVLNGDLRKYILYIAVTLSQFFNTAFILFIYETDPSKYYNSTTVIAASVINLVIFLYLAYSSDKANFPLYPNLERKSIQIEKTSNSINFNKNDFLVITIITLVYSIIAFSNLGDRHAPDSGHIIDANDEVRIEFKNEEVLSKMQYFSGFYPIESDNALTVTFYDSENNFINVFAQNDVEVFCWNSIDLENICAKYATINAEGKVSIKEIAFFNESEIIEFNTDSYALSDEQELVPDQRTYENSTYFDEIYHARTAYEFIHKLPVYEWTHPPLGKIFISLGIRLFGMNPFGWRFIGTLFGILMVPLIYLLAKFLLKKTWLSSITCIMFTFDFMHYVQTRISTIDVYVTFFIMLMYFFMFLYTQKSFYDTPLKKTFIPLGLSGISMGLAIACKWTGIYAAAGIALIFFITLFRRFSEYKTYKDLLPETNRFPSHALKTLVFCCVMFIIVPVMVYMLSYIPYLKANGEGIYGIWKNQIDIFTYHAETVVESTHPYSSVWYSWPVMARPIWYYSASFTNGTEAGISAFGNPLVWWFGIISTVFCAVTAVKNKDKKAIFLLIAYAANFLPWAAVERTMFIYHYFPSVPFIVLMNGYTMMKFYQKNNKAKWGIIAYGICTILLFVLFYPVLTGIPTNPDFVSTFLRWLPGWVLI